MNDIEDIFKAVIAYMRETVGTMDGDPINRLNYLIVEKNSEKGDDLLDQMPDEDRRFVLNQRMREVKMLNSWVDIAVDDDVQLNSNFDAAAKTYAISVSHVIMDNLTDEVFYQSTRMADVLQELMKGFFRDEKHAGFVFGEMERNGLPVRVKVKGSKALTSGVTYLATIQ